MLVWLHSGRVWRNSIFSLFPSLVDIYAELLLTVCFPDIRQMYATIADKNSEKNSSYINNSLSIVAIAWVKPTLNIERGWLIHVLSDIFFHAVIIWTLVVGRSRLTISVRISTFDYHISREPIELKNLSQSILSCFDHRQNYL